MAPRLLIRFAGAAGRLEARAIDPASGRAVATYGLAMMAAWLAREGYRWVRGSAGMWERGI